MEMEYRPGYTNYLGSGPGYYALDASNDGCHSTDTIWVKNDCYMNIPNVFTPNADGSNDYSSTAVSDQGIVVIQDGDL